MDRARRLGQKHSQDVPSAIVGRHGNLNDFRGYGHYRDVHHSENFGVSTGALAEICRLPPSDTAILSETAPNTPVDAPCWAFLVPCHATLPPADEGHPGGLHLGLHHFKLDIPVAIGLPP